MVGTLATFRLGIRKLFRKARLPDNHKTLEETKRLATLCASRGKWLQARDLWGICLKLDSSISNLVNYLEASRLSGTLDIEGFPESVTLEMIIQGLSPKYASHLVGEFIRLTPWNPKYDKILDKYSMGELPEVQQAKAESKIFNTKKNKFDKDKFNVNSIWDSTNHFEDFSSEYKAELPKLNIINDLPLLQESQSVLVRAARVLTINSFNSVIGSDFVESSGEFFGDLVSWQGINSVNFINDSWALAASNTEVIFKQIDSNNFGSVSLTRACWLGYPMSSSWGHWVPDLLTRISYFGQMGLLSDTPVVVAKETPKSFLGFAELLWPGIKWIQLPTHTLVQIETCYLSPARTFSVPNMHWDPSGIEYRCITEPENFRLLRRLAIEALQRNPPAESPVKMGAKIMLDRSLSLYRRSRNSELLRDLAIQNKFEVLDPGSFSPLEQLTIFSKGSSFFGADGSQWLWAILAAEGTNTTIVGHDYSTDSRGRSWTIGNILSKEPSWVLGLRDFPGPGYSEKFYHQDYSLNEQDVHALNHQLSTQ